MDTEIDSNDIFFTIIVPTRERSDTLAYTLRTALAQDYENFEVLVSDNASQDDTAENVERLKDSRLRYVNTGRRVSMSENWEFALNHVRGGWVTVLGDDDAILPGALRRVSEIINKTGVSAIRSNGCSYQWPGFAGSKYGSLNISLRRDYEIRSSGDMLQQVLDGRRNYNELPMLYNGGFVSFELVKQAKSIAGNFFQSMTPDVYSAIVFSLLTESYAYSLEALAINGASLHSGGTAAFEKVKQKRLYDPAERFWGENNIPFHEDLPLMETGRPVRSISIAVYEAFLQAKKFHDFKQVHTSHQKQLEIAIKKSGPDPAEINEWVGLFRRKHNLEIRRSPAGSKTFLRSGKNFLVRVSSLIYFFSLKGNQRLPLRNVYDAAIVACLIKVIKPSLLRNTIQRLYARRGGYSADLYSRIPRYFRNLFGRRPV